MTEMSAAKIEYFRNVRNKRDKCEKFIIAEAAGMGIELTAAQACIFVNAVIEHYGNNTPPAPVDTDENIGSM